MPTTGRCELCERDNLPLTRHHLIPQTRHRNKWNKKNFSRQEVKTSIVLLCGGCHRQLHALFSEKQLERAYHDLDRLRAHPEVRKFVDWIRTKPPGFKPSVSRAHPPAPTATPFSRG